MSLVRRIIQLVLVSLLCALVYDAPAQAASGIYDSNCAGKPATHHVHFYTTKDSTPTLLRCGTSSYGYIHIRDSHGFSSGMDSNIAWCLKDWDTDTVAGTSHTYQRFLGTTGDVMIVVVQWADYNDGYEKGIITAYLKYVGPARSMASTGRAAWPSA